MVLLTKNHFLKIFVCPFISGNLRNDWTDFEGTGEKNTMFLIISTWARVGACDNATKVASND